jgi:hypothetical protein
MARRQGGASVSLAGAPRRCGVRQLASNVELVSVEWRNALTRAIFLLNKTTDGKRQCVPVFNVLSSTFEVGMRFLEGS